MRYSRTRPTRDVHCLSCCAAGFCIERPSNARTEREIVGDGRQSVFASANFRWQVDAIWDIGLVGLFHQGEKFLHFGLEVHFQFLDMAVREGAVT